MRAKALYLIRSIRSASSARLRLPGTFWHPVHAEGSPDLESSLVYAAMENENSSCSRTFQEPSSTGLSVLADPEKPTLE